MGLPPRSYRVAALRIAAEPVPSTLKLAAVWSVVWFRIPPAPPPLAAAMVSVFPDAEDAALQVPDVSRPAHRALQAQQRRAGGALDPHGGVAVGVRPLDVQRRRGTVGADADERIRGRSVEALDAAEDEGVAGRHQ